MHKSQIRKIDPYDCFCAPWSHISLELFCLVNAADFSPDSDQNTLSLEEALLWIIDSPDLLQTRSFCLLQMITDGLEWCGLLWCFIRLSFWRHPFTAEHPLLRHISPNLMKNQTPPDLGWPAPLTLWLASDSSVLVSTGRVLADREHRSPAPFEAHKSPGRLTWAPCVILRLSGVLVLDEALERVSSRRPPAFLRSAWLEMVWLFACFLIKKEKWWLHSIYLAALKLKQVPRGPLSS